MAGWTVGAMVAGGAAVSAQEASEIRPFLTVTVRVTDYAHLSPLDLANAQAQATDAYRAVGLDIVWLSAPRGPGPGRMRDHHRSMYASSSSPATWPNRNATQRA